MTIPNAPELLAACKAVLDELDPPNNDSERALIHTIRLAIANAERDGMTAAEHIVRWIECSGPHYARLLKLSVPGNFISNRDRAGFAFALAADAQREMVKGGNAYRHEQDEMALLRAAADLCEWRPEA